MATVLHDREALPVDRLTSGPVLEVDAERWKLEASDARDAALARSAFRIYLEMYGTPACDFDAAEAVYGELVSNCVTHAPGPIRVEFTWRDRTLSIVDGCDRLHTWPFSPDDTAAETTHHAYAILAALGGGVHVARADGGGTRARVVLPVMRY